MSEERFNRIDATLADINGKLVESDRRFDHIDRKLIDIDGRLAESDRRFGRTDERLDRMDQRFDRMDERFDRMDERFDSLHEEVRHMGVLYEHAITTLADSHGYTGPTREEFAELKEMIGRRIEPLEKVVRRHSADIEDLKRNRR